MDPVGERTDVARRRRHIVILLVFLGIIALLIFAFRAVLMPFLVALFVAYLIDPVVERMAPVRVFRSYPLGRGGAIVVLYLVFLFLVYLAIKFAGPALAGQVRQVRTDLPAAQEWAEEKINYLSERWQEFIRGKAPEGGAAGEGARPEGEPEEEEAAPEELPEPPPDAGPPRSRFHLKGGGIVEGDVVARSEGQVVLRLGDEYEVLRAERISSEERLRANAQDPASALKGLIRRGVDQGLRNLDVIVLFVFQFGQTLVLTIYKLVLILMITAFLVIDRDRILGFLRTVPPARYRATYEKLSTYIDRGLAGVVRGQLLICLVNGILTWIGLQFLGVRYSGLLGVIAGIFSLIPIFGTILSTIPIVLIAWGAPGGGFQDALLALGWILLIHFVEANYLNPRIMGSASKIHPVVVIFALLAGEHAYGLVGALLAVPCASIVQSSFKFYVLDRQGEAAEEQEEVTIAAS